MTRNALRTTNAWVVMMLNVLVLLSYGGSAHFQPDSGIGWEVVFLALGLIQLYLQTAVLACVGGRDAFLSWR